MLHCRNPTFVKFNILEVDLILALNFQVTVSYKEKKVIQYGDATRLQLVF